MFGLRYYFIFVTDDSIALVRLYQPEQTALALTTVLETTGGIRTIEDGINRFMEGSSILLKALDEVAKVHPFVAGKFARAH